MTEPLPSDESGQKHAFFHEQAEYWKAFLADLFVGTVKRMTISPIVFGVTFTAIAYLLYRLSIKPQHIFFLVKWLETFLLFLIYVPIGIVTGLTYGANTTLMKKSEEVERGVHLIVTPVMAAIITRLPGGQASISVQEFTDVLDEQIARFTQGGQLRWRFWSLLGLFSRFFVRMTLKILRYLLLHDFLEFLEDREKTDINAQTVELYQREKLISSLVGILIGKVEFVQKVIYGILIVFLAVPVLIMLLF
jgi:hypothetical protein